MDINPLIADLNKFKEELIDSIQIAIGLNELHNADRFVAHDIEEIKGELHSSDPFQQVAILYNLPREEVVENIRQFTNRACSIIKDLARSSFCRILHSQK